MANVKSITSKPASAAAANAAPAKTMRLDATFVRKTGPFIKSKAGRNTGIWSLPFVSIKPTKSGVPHWGVPASGGYFGGYETGEAMALAFLKFLREDKIEWPQYHLTSIVESFMVRFQQEDGIAMKALRPGHEPSDSFASFRGQYIGFFNTISEWLAASARSLGGNLDRLAEQDLVAIANSGLRFDDKAYMASLDDDDVSENVVAIESDVHAGEPA